MPHQINVANASVKRRVMHDDSENSFSPQSLWPANPVKRLHQKEQQPEPEPAPKVTVPSLTFASPDYRPPPRPDALWLQPVPQPTTFMMEEDSTDDDDALRTPSIHVPPIYHTPVTSDCIMHDMA
ncbi:hypothetical protein DM01DRAFT_1336476 [Hesseltinella vesiculosa]|uniref:Uncharacterized protein n=1 Tax=Hesseltinella vesiculosa TaxID=101127 RepID=A0A1X2GFH5_9FUNG|nr:hypothetical protein DM01DRAFT_1336476 [Hesseltinella vesiculosa]